jgi:hypothetical protein
MSEIMYGTGCEQYTVYVKPPHCKTSDFLGGDELMTEMLLRAG